MLQTEGFHTNNYTPKNNTPNNNQQIIPHKKSSMSSMSSLNLNFNNLPTGLKISTMTLTCSLDTLINIENIGKYIDITFGNIVYIKYGNTENEIRTIIIKKSNKKDSKKNSKNINSNKKKRSNTKPDNNFYNQASIYIEINEETGKTVNTKVFQNGSIQMTGCTTINDFISAMNILCKELCKKKVVYDKISGNIIKKEFVTKPENICVSKIHNFKIQMDDPVNGTSPNIHNFKIRMINSNFKSGFMISREILYNILTKENITCTFEPCIHACVNIKHNYKNGETVSIFVFESGSILITGAKTKRQIIESYQFIIKILYKHFGSIVKYNINDFLKKKEIKKLIDKSIKQKIKKENK